MKKNAFQILTSVLCFVLLVITFCLAKKIEMLEQQTENRIEYLQDSLNQKMQNLYADFHRELEASNSVVEEFSLEPVGLDSDTGNLAANLLVQLKQWSEDTVVTLYAEMDGTKIEVYMEVSAEGICRGQLLVPLKTGSDFSLTARISTAGIMHMEQLGNWGDISMLLPLFMSGSSWSGPNYSAGAMTTKFDITMEAPGELEVHVFDPAFSIYKNGALVETVAAVTNPHTYSPVGVSYTIDTQGNFYALDCEPNDVIEIRFRCTDAYGLYYDFPVMLWSPEQKLPESQIGDSLILSWEK